MAINTEDKRRSVQAYTFGLLRPLPDSTIGSSDRHTVAWLYAFSASEGELPGVSGAGISTGTGIGGLGISKGIGI